MKKLFFFFVILSCSLVFAQQRAACNNTIGGDTVSQPPACSARYPTIGGALDTWNTATGTGKQVWALHNADQSSDLSSTGTPDPEPTNTVNAVLAGCNTANQRCLNMGGDNCTNWSVKLNDHCKFAYLYEQRRVDVGEFAMLVVGQTQDNGIAFDTLQSNSFTNHGGICNAMFTPVIGDCGQGVGVPCIGAVQVNTPGAGQTTITLTWAKPASTAILYQTDGEGNFNGCDYGAGAYNFTPANATAALDSMITAWEVYYADTNAAPVSGQKSSYTFANDTDGGKVTVGARTYSGNDYTATIVVPAGIVGNIVVAVAPVFDGNPGPMRELIPTGTKTVALRNVVSKSSDPINPTPVTISSFTGHYADLQHVVLAWETASETDAMGFNLYRSIGGANWTKINAAIIPATGQGGAGATYSFTDNLPKQRVFQKWQYKVEEMSSTGVRVAEVTTEVTK